MNEYRILTGDAIEQLRTLPDGCVHCVVTSPPYWGLRAYLNADDPDKHLELGAEQTPAEYVANLVAVFREVRRVLRDDGTVWLNLGDSYNGSGGAGGDYGKGGLREGQPKYNGRNVGTLKPKDLVGIPWRVAFALQDDGWWLRSRIIWAKRAPMPESVTDRPTRSSEEIFLLTKRARYFYDAEAVRENSTMHPVDWNDDGTPKRDSHKRGEFGGKNIEPGKEAFRAISPTRNLSDVWLLGPEPYPEAHFATFPTEIPRRCIKAGTSERGCCPACGAPWRRVVERERSEMTGARTPKTDKRIDEGLQSAKSGLGMPGWRKVNGAQSTTTGWQPTCACDAGEPVPATVLDPFGGSGTTAAVAIEQGRDAIIIELNPEYVTLARRRIQDVAPLLSIEVDV